MTNQQHPVVPDPELLQEWYDDKTDYFTDMIRAAQWGADQELEACCEWLGDAPVVYNDNSDLHPGVYLRDARRSRPLSLKQQALQELNLTEDLEGAELSRTQVDLIRRALEALPE